MKLEGGWLDATGERSFAMWVNSSTEDRALTMDGKFR